MSFVAQTYEQFVSDLLTSLTGGISREEHRFKSGEDGYTLTVVGARPESIRVSGQQGEAFGTFALGNDYTFDEAANVLRWKKGGSQPDDHSYFYVSYYTNEARPRLTDRNPGSVTTTLGEAFARELAVLHQQMLAIYNSGFVDTATNSALDHVVALMGLTRKDARFATGEVLFRRSTPAPGDVAIFAGTVVSTDLGQNFETTDKRTLRRGQLSVTVQIRAQVEGPAGKVDAGAIKNVNRPIFGIESVTNEAATFFATQKETDEELRRRARGTLERAGKSTVDAIRYALIEDLPEVTDANIQVVEAEIPGTVTVRLGLDGSATPDLVQRVEESIFNSRPAGVRVLHNLPSGSVAAGQDITRQQALADFQSQGEPRDINHLPGDVIESMPQDVLRVRIEVFLRLTQPNLTASQKETIEDVARTTVTDYITNLPMGLPIIYSKLLGLIVAPEEIGDAALLVGAEADGIFHSYTGNLSTEGRKAKAATVFVGLMEEEVSIEVLARVHGANGKDLPSNSGQIVTAVQTEATRRVNEILAAVQNGLSKKQIADAIRSALTATAPDLQLIEDNPVVLNAKYDETGRVLNDTDQLPLEEHQLPVLRKLTVMPMGALDA
jgi:uncharacterized phage protein gp47/JayE